MALKSFIVLIDANTVWNVYFTVGTVGPFDKVSAGLGFGYVRAIRLLI